MAVRKRAANTSTGGSVAVAEVPADGEIAEEVTADEAQKELTDKKPRAPRPTFELVKVGAEMPPPSKRGGGRGRGKSTEYRDAFQQVKDVADGEVYQIAQFYTKTGANAVANEIRKGKREIPGGEWEVESRTTEDGSILLVRYLGEEAKAG